MQKDCRVGNGCLPRLLTLLSLASFGVRGTPNFAVAELAACVLWSSE